MSLSADENEGSVLLMEDEDSNGKDTDVPEVAHLRLKAASLKQELKECRAELAKLQKQLSNSERLQKSTESYNEDLRKQVDQLSAEVHERKKKDKDRVNTETQTEDYVWTEADYYNYYYGGYCQNMEGVQPEETVNPETATAEEAAVDVTDYSAAAQVGTANEAAVTDVSAPQENSDVVVTEEGDGGSIADILRATAEQAMTQTGFVFDETSGMYYDHSTGFYYDSASQLYYDASTGIYYYYDAESGRYQFHSKIEMPAAQNSNEPGQEQHDTDKKWRKFKKVIKKTPHQDDKVQDVTNSLAKMKISPYWKTSSYRVYSGRFIPANVQSDQFRFGSLKSETHALFSNERFGIYISKSAGLLPLEMVLSLLTVWWQELKSEDVKRTKEETDQVESKKPHRRSRSPKTSRSKKESSRHREERDRSSSKRRKLKNGSHHEDRGRSRKKRKKSKSEKHRKKKSQTRSDESGNSEPEEGELTESEREDVESTPSPSSSVCSKKSRESPVNEVEVQTPEAVKSIWPPCVRVTVVRSPVLQVGTLFIITADSSATFGREKDMDHAVQIPEMGVSKFHAEVYFDQEQQGYMLVDQGSQNGTVINGNRILQPKTKSEPHLLTHGDEVKMGETVLSFHIHSGTDTCDGCEPGQVMAHLSKYKREESTGPGLSKEDKESLRQKELKQMKAKYGLQSAEFEEGKALKNPRYKDRAESRRQAVGSEGVFQRDDAPASVHEEISEVNKGRKMLEKMGWKKGEGLGKEGTGMKNPIELKIRKSQSGLGAGAVTSVDDMSVTRSRSHKNWEKARERFADTCQTDLVCTTTQKNPSPKAWVRSEETEVAQPGIGTASSDS